MKKGKLLTKFATIILILVLVVGVGIKFGYDYINKKISLMNIQSLDKAELGISEEVYKDVSDGTKVIALFGSDARINDPSIGVRADAIMICSLDTVNHKINFISIPRDTYVSIEGYGKTKINHAYSYGKEQLAIKTINQNFDLAIDEYVTIDFSGLISVINALGGVDLEISEAEKRYINEKVDESYDLSGKTRTYLESAGAVHLNGEQALTHTRNRTVGSDFERAKRQRDVMEAIVKQSGTLNIPKAMDLSNIVLKQIKTNVDAWKYVRLIPNFIKNIEAYKASMVSVQLPAAEYSKDKYIKGIYYFATDIIKAKADFKKYVYGVEPIE
ncbi:MAG: LCP family protein [Clostridia bacterium]